MARPPSAPARSGHVGRRADRRTRPVVRLHVPGREAAVRLAAEQRVAAMELSDAWVAAGCRMDDPLLAAERLALVASYAALREGSERRGSDPPERRSGTATLSTDLPAPGHRRARRREGGVSSTSKEKTHDPHVRGHAARAGPSADREPSAVRRPAPAAGAAPGARPATPRPAGWTDRTSRIRRRPSAGSAERGSSRHAGRPNRGPGCPTPWPGAVRWRPRWSRRCSPNDRWPSSTGGWPRRCWPTSACISAAGSPRAADRPSR